MQIRQFLLGLVGVILIVSSGSSFRRNLQQFDGSPFMLGKLTANVAFSAIGICLGVAAVKESYKK